MAESQWLGEYVPCRTSHCEVLWHRKGNWLNIAVWPCQQWC